MDIKEARIYVRQLKYFYEEIIFFVIICLIMFFGWFKPCTKMWIGLCGWLVTLLLRGFYLNNLTSCCFGSLQNYVNKVRNFFSQWEEKKLQILQKDDDPSEEDKTNKPL